jgi:hypothetical protein
MHHLPKGRVAAEGLRMKHAEHDAKFVTHFVRFFSFVSKSGMVELAAK